MDELKPCPFVKDGLHEVSIDEIRPGEFAVVCVCGAQGPIYGDAELAAIAWNSYTSANESPSDWDELESAICIIEKVQGFGDETSCVGEAWEVVKASLSHARQSESAIREEIRRLRGALQETVDRCDSWGCSDWVVDEAMAILNGRETKAEIKRRIQSNPEQTSDGDDLEHRLNESKREGEK